MEFNDQMVIHLLQETDARSLVELCIKSTKAGDQWWDTHIKNDHGTIYGKRITTTFTVWRVINMNAKLSLVTISRYNADPDYIKSIGEDLLMAIHLGFLPNIAKVSKE